MSDPFRDPRPLVEGVYAYVATMIGDGPAAQDVTSDAVERGLRYRSSYDPRRGTPLSWLIGIARRCLADAARATAALPADAAAELLAPGDLEGEAVDRIAVRAALASLSPRDRELLALRYAADLTARQIGEVLGLRTNAVEVALHRALAQLRPAFAHERRQGARERPRKGFDLAGGM